MLYRLQRLQLQFDNDDDGSDDDDAKNATAAIGLAIVTEMSGESIAADDASSFIFEQRD